MKEPEYTPEEIQRIMNQMPEAIAKANELLDLINEALAEFEPTKPKNED